MKMGKSDDILISAMGQCDKTFVVSSYSFTYTSLWAIILLSKHNDGDNDVLYRHRVQCGELITETCMKFLRGPSFKKTKNKRRARRNPDVVVCQKGQGQSGH